MYIRRFSFIILLLCCGSVSFCQQKMPGDYIAWSPGQKLTVNNFIIKTGNGQTTPSFAQFTISYQAGGFDFMAKNFNRKVGNYFIKAASWIDTSFDVAQSVRYQQTLFDLAEVYARRFRKELKAHKGKLTNGANYINELNARIMADFAQRRIEYDTDTNYVTAEAKQAEWEGKIKGELEELEEYAVETKTK